MKRFRVFEPADAAGASDRARFLRDGFSIWAFLLPVPWLLWHRLFVSAVLVLAVEVAITWQAGARGFGLAAFALPLLIGLLVALEGPSLRAWKLTRKGWRETAALMASDQGEAEMRYYAGRTAGGEDGIRTPDPDPDPAAPLTSDESRPSGQAPSPLSDKS